MPDHRLKRLGVRRDALAWRWNANDVISVQSRVPAIRSYDSKDECSAISCELDRVDDGHGYAIGAPAYRQHEQDIVVVYALTEPASKNRIPEGVGMQTQYKKFPCRPESVFLRILCSSYN